MSEGRRSRFAVGIDGRPEVVRDFIASYLDPIDQPEVSRIPADDVLVGPGVDQTEAAMDYHDIALAKGGFTFRLNEKFYATWEAGFTVDMPRIKT